MAFWPSLLQPLLLPTPEPLAFSTDAGALEGCGCRGGDGDTDAVTVGLPLLPMELWLAEAG
jgi:hypothetical protein